MSDDLSLSQFPNGTAHGDGMARADSELVAQGWMRRTIADERRARELVALYEDLGFEVLTRSITSVDFESTCGRCAEIAGDSYVLIYVRRSNRLDDSADRTPSSATIDDHKERK